jgi:uncharacterized protein YbjT (DUF2867 family)
MKIILTGATGMVGEGVLLECLQNPQVDSVLIINRRHYDLQHPKLNELLVPDFLQIEKYAGQLAGYDACFYCAGISSNGMKEAEYTRITYDTPLHLAKTLLSANPSMVFCHISGKSTDSSEKGMQMWARVKGKAENALMKLPFKKVYNFRPGLMKPMPGQKNIKSIYRIILKLYPVFKIIFPNVTCTLREVALAMINSVSKGYSRQILEVKDIQLLSRE